VAFICVVVIKSRLTSSWVQLCCPIATDADSLHNGTLQKICYSQRCQAVNCLALRVTDSISQTISIKQSGRQVHNTVK